MNVHKDRLGFDEPEDRALAKSTRSLNSTSSCFSCLVGVGGLRERFWVCPTKLSYDEPDPRPSCWSKNCCLRSYFDGGGGRKEELWDCESHGAGGSGSADLLVGVGSSYTGFPVERGEEDGGVEVETVKGGREVSKASSDL